MPENEDEFSISDYLEDAQSRMDKSIESFKKDLTGIRTARASTSMVDGIEVEAYGAMMPLNQLATISIPEPRMIMITPFDKGSIVTIEKGLMKSDLNINPQSDGVVIRLILPELTQERRQELVKQVKSRLEDCRVAIRNIRRDVNDEIKKLKGHSEDEVKSGQDDLQKLTDKHVKTAEDYATKKEESIISV